MIGSPVIIVDDGQYAWAADAGDLLDALDRLGWTRAGAIWIEPDGPDPSDDPAGVPYALLCDATSALADGPDVWAQYPGAAVLSYAPDRGGWTWTEGQQLEEGVWRVEGGEAVDVSDDPLGDPVDGHDSILVLARTEEEAVWLARLYDDGMVEAGNVRWWHQTIVAVDWRPRRRCAPDRAPNRCRREARIRGGD